MHRTPTLIRRLVTGVAAATLGLPGLPGLPGLAAAPAHAATRPAPAAIGPTCGNSLGPVMVQYTLIACTLPTFAHPWYVRGNESQTADATITNETPYTLSVSGGGGVIHAPGNTWYVDNFGHLTLAPHGQPGSASTFQVTEGISGPVTNQTQVVNGVDTIGLSYGVAATGDPHGKIGTISNGFYPAIDAWPTGQPHIWSFTAGAAATSEHVGVPDKITVTNNSPKPEWFELCQGVHPVAAGMHAPGTSLVHSVVEDSPGTTTWTAWVGTGAHGCTFESNVLPVNAYLETQAIHIDWTGQPVQPAPTVPTDPAPALIANATNPGPSTSTVDPIYVTDTSGHPEWLDVCAGGRAVSAGFHQPGTSLVYGARSTRAGTVTYSAYVGTPLCSGTPVPVSVDWAAGSTTSFDHQLFADAAVYTPTVGTDDPVFAINTSGHGQWMTMCSGLTPLASGYHPAGGYLEHAVSAYLSSPGQDSYTAVVGRDSCNSSQSQSSTVTLRWQSAS